uniref:SRPBCC family protein n=1 Tax=Roseihalotalea indica TaxID=2867963 RepID=A0AA49JI10_9BACT|nr:SRPBCC family protein [Tunicatimonas sp. TK19036]
MNLLKKILAGIFIIVALFLLVALFLPSTYHVERSVVIQLPVEEVYPFVSNLNEWADWNPWTQTDPTVETTIIGSGHEIGSVWSWDGEKVGVGSLTIQELEPNKLMQSRLAFLKPQMFESDDIWTFEPINTGTKVTWINEGKLSYPVDRLFGLFMDGMLGRDFERGLENLKHITENS